jgi:hypothetical protein
VIGSGRGPARAVTKAPAHGGGSARPRARAAINAPAHGGGSGRGRGGKGLGGDEKSRPTLPLVPNAAERAVSVAAPPALSQAAPAVHQAAAPVPFQAARPAASGPEAEAPFPKAKRQKLSSALPWSTEEEIALLDLMGSHPQKPSGKAYERFALQLGTGRSGPAVKQHCNGQIGFWFLAEQVVERRPNMRALPFKIPKWCDFGPRSGQCPGAQFWEARRFDRLKELMMGAQPQQLCFDGEESEVDAPAAAAPAPTAARASAAAAAQHKNACEVTVIVPAGLTGGDWLTFPCGNRTGRVQLPAGVSAGTRLSVKVNARALPA